MARKSRRRNRCAVPDCENRGTIYIEVGPRFGTYCPTHAREVLKNGESTTVSVRGSRYGCNAEGCKKKPVVYLEIGETIRPDGGYLCIEHAMEFEPLKDAEDEAY